MNSETAIGGGRHILIEKRKLYARVTGALHPAPSVILIAGGGGTTDTWTAIQDAIAEHSPVLSYDRAGLGRSDSADEPQSLDDMLRDLLILMAEAQFQPPFILVGHSVGGLHARKLANIISNDLAGIVLVDSSHDEQVWRLGEACPEILDLEYGPIWRYDGAMRRLGWLLDGERSTWALDVPLTVIEHRRTGRANPFPTLSEDIFFAFEETWHAMQQDLAGRSAQGRLLEAWMSGHGICASQPELVVEAIADIVRDRCQTELR